MFGWWICIKKKFQNWKSTIINDKLTSLFFSLNSRTNHYNEIQKKKMIDVSKCRSEHFHTIKNANEIEMLRTINTTQQQQIIYNIIYTYIL